jgi:hypothetical protein
MVGMHPIDPTPATTNLLAPALYSLCIPHVQVLD